MLFRKKKRAPRTVALIGLLIGIVCSNTTPIFSKILEKSGWTPVSLYFMTLLVMTIFMAVHEFMLLETGGKWGMTKEDVKGTILTTITGGVISPLLFFYGLSYVMASESVLITSMLPLFIVIFSAMFLKESFNEQTIIGGTALLVGLVILLLPDIRSAQLSWGVPMLIGSSLTGAMTTIIHKKYVKHRHLDSITLARTAMSLVIITVWMWIVEPQSFSILVQHHNVWLVIGLPVVGFLMPYFFYFRSLEHLKAMEVGMISGAGPVAGVVLSAIFLNETISHLQMISLCFMILGILSINVPLTKWRIVPSRLPEIGPLRR